MKVFAFILNTLILDLFPLELFIPHFGKKGNKMK